MPDGAGNEPGNAHTSDQDVVLWSDWLKRQLSRLVESRAVALPLIVTGATAFLGWLLGVNARDLGRQLAEHYGIPPQFLSQETPAILYLIALVMVASVIVAAATAGVWAMPGVWLRLLAILVPAGFVVGFLLFHPRPEWRLLQGLIVAALVLVIAAVIWLWRALTAYWRSNYAAPDSAARRREVDRVGDAQAGESTPDAGRAAGHRGDWENALRALRTRDVVNYQGLMVALSILFIAGLTLALLFSTSLLFDLVYPDNRIPLEGHWATSARPGTEITLVFMDGSTAALRPLMEVVEGCYEPTGPVELAPVEGLLLERLQTSAVLGAEVPCQ